MPQTTPVAAASAPGRLIPKQSCPHPVSHRPRSPPLPQHRRRRAFSQSPDSDSDLANLAASSEEAHRPRHPTVDTAAVPTAVAAACSNTFRERRPRRERQQVTFPPRQKSSTRATPTSQDAHRHHRVPPTSGRDAARSTRQTDGDQERSGGGASSRQRRARRSRAAPQPGPPRSTREQTKRGGEVANGRVEGGESRSTACRGDVAGWYLTTGRQDRGVCVMWAAAASAPDAAVTRRQQADGKVAARWQGRRNRGQVPHGQSGTD